ncbi:MAG TPA: hypothetical protein VK051_04245 [Paenalcaligenes sp.]|nr:hypothetical protein [Paenalcaligenes sp.]
MKYYYKFVFGLFLSIYSLSWAYAHSAHIKATEIKVNQLEQAVWSKLQLAETDASDARSTRESRLQRLLLTVQWQHPADLDIQLCNAQRQRCQRVPPDGRLLSNQFAGQKMDAPLWLKITAHSWRGGYPPAYLRAELVLWTQPI